MRQFSSDFESALDEIAQRHGFSNRAVLAMLEALRHSNGRMAQFNHPEFGGYGQWMRGGMTMVSDMFNTDLKARVDRLCSELAGMVEDMPDVSSAPSERGNWWPGDLGWPTSSGAQNDARYAYFEQTHRLAIEANGRVTVYDTLDHRIGGVSQQQSSRGSLSFTSQHGLVDVASLPVVSGIALTGVAAPDSPSPGSEWTEQAPGTDVLATIEKLALLHAKGILTDDEFRAKKAELLARI